MVPIATAPAPGSVPLKQNMNRLGCGARVIRIPKREENSGINWPPLLWRTMIGEIAWGFAGKVRNRLNSLREAIEHKEKMNTQKKP
jgi:hypothetical protein